MQQALSIFQSILHIVSLYISMVILRVYWKLVPLIYISTGIVDLGMVSIYINIYPNILVIIKMIQAVW